MTSAPATRGTQQHNNTHPDDPGPTEPAERDGLNSADDLPRLWHALDLKPAKQPRWLAKGRLPSAAVSLLVGDEGIGKSLLWVWIVAAVTTGKPLPEFGIPARDPSHVILVLTEDEWCDTVLPRLEVAQADLSMIGVICTDSDGSGSPIFPRDLYLIREADPRPTLIVVDGWLDTVPSGMSVRDPQQARQALHPWRETASKTGAAVLLLTHTNRVASPNARDRYGAIGALRQKARLTLFAQRDDDGTLVVGPEKANGARATAASRFTIAPIPHFKPTEDHDGTVPLLKYAGESEHTAKEHVADAYAIEHRATASTAITDWLTTFLADGPRPATAIYTAGEVLGYSKDRLKRAKRDIPITTYREGGEGGAWFWRLPDSAPIPTAPLLPSTTPPSTSKESTESQREQGSTDTRVCTCGAPLTREQSILSGQCRECHHSDRGSSAS